MQHLSEEALARLVDEAPDEAEAVHLEHCEHCRVELEEMSRQTRALEMLPDLAAPAGEWRTLAARLAEEDRFGRRSRWAVGWPRQAMRAAAGLALFLGGAATGALALRPGPAAVTPAAPVAATPATTADPAAQLRAAEAAYMRALSRYSESEGVRAPDPLNRLAALEGIVLTTRAALEAAPEDPVINGYHLSAVGQRDALLRQIDQSAEQPWF